jgi:integration host factor subunit alpha
MASKLVSTQARCVTRAALANVLYQHAKVSRADAHGLVAMLLDEVTEALVRCEGGKLSSFGTFVSRSKRERIGRNPKTEIETAVSARRVVVFKASRILVGRLNGQLQFAKPRTAWENQVSLSAAGNGE